MPAYDFVGETIGSYRILERIGSGGMGRVYRGVHLHLDRIGAVKVMHGHLASDPDFQARFRREARAAASLEHANIVAIHDFGEQDGLLYLIMELLTDGSVRTLLREQSADISRDVVASIDFVRQAAEGLAYAHRRGMIHRDVKPENLLLKQIEDEAGQSSPYVVKVADFGLARLAESSTMTMSGALMGTPPYMSPEQCQGNDLDSRSDQYSLGVVLYEVVSGRRPFEAKTPTEAAYKHVFVEPPPPSDFRPEMDRELEEVILRALAKRPDQRFATTSEFVRALRSIQARLAQVDLDPFTSPPLGVATLPHIVLSPTLVNPDVPTGRMIDSPTEPETMVQRTNEPTLPSEPGIEFTLDRDVFSVTPGEPASVGAFIANHGISPARMALTVQGVPAGWVQLSTPSIELDPGELASVDLWINVPLTTQEASGAYPVTLSLCSENDADDNATTTAQLELLPLPPPLLVLPLRSRDARQAEYEVRLRHDRDAPDRYAFLFESGSDALVHRFDPEHVSLDAGEIVTASLSVKTPTFRFGPSRSHPFAIVAEGEDSGVHREASGLFRQTGLVPLWAPVVLAVAMIGTAILLSTVLSDRPGKSVAAAAPRIDSVTINPPNPIAGQPVTIRWQVTDADLIDIAPLVTGLDPSAGSYTFQDGIDDGDDLTLVASNDEGTVEERLLLAVAPETATVTPTEPAASTAASEPTIANSATATRTPTSRPIVTRTPTATATQTATSTTTPTATATASLTPANTPIPTPTNTLIPTPTNTPAPPPPTNTLEPPPPTNTPVPPQPTNTPVPPVVTVPAAPSSLSVSSGGSGEVHLSWIDNSSNENGFTIYSSTYLPLGSAGPGAQSASVSGLPSGTTACLLIVAFNDAGESGPSNTACAAVN